MVLVREITVAVTTVTVLRIAGKGLGVVIGPGGGGPGQDHPETGGHVADRGDPETNSGPDRETDSGPDPETDDLGIDDLAPKRGAAQDRRAHGGPGMIESDVTPRAAAPHPPQATLAELHLAETGPQFADMLYQGMILLLNLRTILL